MSAHRHSRSALVKMLCLATAIVEGFDMQSAGVAAPAMIKSLSLDPQQVGWVFTASTTGLLIGAFLGGRLADLLGRKSAWLISLAVVALFSFGTSIAQEFYPLLAMRFFAGVGMGGAMPSVIAAAAEAAPHDRVRSTVAAIYAGFPLGGSLVSLFSMLNFHDGWRSIFLVGAILPLIMFGAVAALLHLPPPPKIEAESLRPNAPLAQTLFQGSRLSLTLMLWVALFSSLLVLYVLQSWLPTLLTAKRFTPSESGMVQFLMNLGGAIGCYGIGRLLDRYSRTGTIAANTLVLVGSLAVLAVVATPSFAFACALPLGLALNASQAILYSIAPTIYPTLVRGTGVGAAMAVARLGSITGPLITSFLLVGGMTADQVLLFLLPVVALSGAVSLLLVLRQNRAVASSSS